MGKGDRSASTSRQPQDTNTQLSGNIPAMIRTQGDSYATPSSDPPCSPSHEPSTPQAGGSTAPSPPQYLKLTDLQAVAADIKSTLTNNLYHCSNNGCYYFLTAQPKTVVRPTSTKQATLSRWKSSENTIIICISFHTLLCVAISLTARS